MPQVDPSTSPASSIRIAGRDIEYRRIASEGDAPTIVFLHEGLGSLGLWRDFPGALCARLGYGGIVYSRYGNGFSQALDAARTAEYMHDEARIALPELLDALGLEKPLLFGHSDGASIALIFAGTFPERVSALVLEAPHVVVEPLSLASIAKIREAYRVESLRERMRKHHADVDRTFFGWNDVWLCDAFASWNIAGFLEPILAPALCIQGSDDEYGTVAQVDAIAAGSGGAVDRLILDHCGHAPHRDRAHYVRDATAAWIENLSQR